ncbi:MAG: M14 family metallopeptidase, partial [Ignavibacteria bacterium]|nr:M14 family metallopeptidase [Ignavibacteria bacterium]
MSFFISLVLLTNSFVAQDIKSIKTIAELSNYESTSTYNDVIHFISILKKQSNLVQIENIATTVEGHEIPLVIIADPMPKDLNKIKLDPRIKVYIQGNIHAGEVEGKEALLMFARDILNGNKELLKDVILLLCPIFNADGNEPISPKNRTNQNGPKNGVGIRYNGQNLDLNRDAMKLESQEVQGLVKNVLNKYDPAVFLDCHTTNGSYHEEPVTFVWQMNCNGDTSLISYMQDKMMPDVSSTLSKKYNTLNCFYGEFIDQRDYSKGWISYAFEPRYIVNYVGLRNRLAILNENYV